MEDVCCCLLLFFGGSDKCREAREGQRDKKSSQGAFILEWEPAIKCQTSSDWRHVERSVIKSRVLEKRPKGKFAMSQACARVRAYGFVCLK